MDPTPRGFCGSYRVILRMSAPYHTENEWVEGQAGAVKGLLHPDGRMDNMSL
jgi:hypothetical protein